MSKDMINMLASLVKYGEKTNHKLFDAKVLDEIMSFVVVPDDVKVEFLLDNFFSMFEHGWDQEMSQELLALFDERDLFGYEKLLISEAKTFVKKGNKIRLKKPLKIKLDVYIEQERDYSIDFKPYLFSETIMTDVGKEFTFKDLRRQIRKKLGKKFDKEELEFEENGELISKSDHFLYETQMKIKYY